MLKVNYAIKPRGYDNITYIKFLEFSKAVKFLLNKCI